VSEKDVKKGQVLYILTLGSNDIFPDVISAQKIWSKKGSKLETKYKKIEGTLKSEKNSFYPGTLIRPKIQSGIDSPVVWGHLTNIV